MSSEGKIWLQQIVVNDSWFLEDRTELQSLSNHIKTNEIHERLCKGIELANTTPVLNQSTNSSGSQTSSYGQTPKTSFKNSKFGQSIMSQRASIDPKDEFDPEARANFFYLRRESTVLKNNLQMIQQTLSQRRSSLRRPSIVAKSGIPLPQSGQRINTARRKTIIPVSDFETFRTFTTLEKAKSQRGSVRYLEAPGLPSMTLETEAETPFMNTPNAIQKTKIGDPKLATNESWRQRPMSEKINNSEVDPKTNSAFVQIWTKIILLVQTYNIVTCFFFLGISGFPTGLWLVFEVISEIITLGDFIFRLICRLKLRKIWKDMTLLHDNSSQSYFHFACIALASIPQSFILIFCCISNPQILLTLPIGFCRCLKLMGMHNITHYFVVVDLQFKRKSANSWMKFSQMMYFLFLFVHVMACVWLLTNRLDPETDTAGWYKMDSLDIIPHPIWQEYVDSFFWTHSELSGVGFGNLVPSTNLEWIICSIIEIVGVSIYLQYYAEVICEIYSRNKLVLANHKKWEDAKQFATVRKMPQDVTESINKYYKFFRMQFDEFFQKNELLAKLPKSLQSELTLIFNAELIQSVNFFQLAEPGFILILLKNLYPQICMLGDSVFKADDIADKMFFIHYGQVEILCADDSKTVIANQVKGSYFGEIGILITQRRTASVKAIITSILYFVERDQLLEILEQFPKQGKFLRAVGRQRLKTTTLLDLQHVDQKVKVRGFEDSLDDLVHKDTCNYNYLFSNGTIHAEKMLVATRIQAKIDQDITYEGFQEPIRDEQKIGKTRPWLTSKHNVVMEFIIVPYSLVHLTWNLVLAAVTLWYFFIVPYNIAVNQDINQYLNGFGILVLILDIPFRALTSIKDPKTYCFNRQEVLKYYFNKWLVIDLIATMPFDLFLMAFVEAEYIRWLMTFKLLKMARLYELTETLKYNGGLNSKIGTILQLVCYFPLAGHISACMFCYVGLPEFKNPQRYDGKSLYWSMNSFNWAIQGPADTLSPFELYVQMWYMGGCLMTGAGYGDLVPWALPEILWYTFAMFISDFLIAFSYAEIESYLEQKYQAVEENSAKVNLNLAWMKRCKLPDSLVNRVVKYYTNLWKDFRGVNDESILADLPHSLQSEIRQELFSSLLSNWKELNYGKSQGLRCALCEKLSIAVYPKNEYVIRCNEIGQEMYFIIQGACTVYSQSGGVLMEFKNGDHFGEMALLKPVARTRGATIKTTQKTTLAVLELKDFKRICKIYPEFLESIQNAEKERKTTTSFQEAIRKKIIFMKDQIDQQSLKKQKTITFEDSQRSSLKSKTPLSIPSVQYENSFVSSANAVAKVAPEELAEMRYKTMDEYFNSSSKSRKTLKKIKKALTFKNVMLWTIFALQTYNFILIPLQFGFRLEVHSYILVLEAITIAVYLVDAISRLKFLRSMHKLSQTPNEDLNEDQLKLKRCQPEKKAAIISDNRIEIVTSLLACIPFSVMFSWFDYWDPWWLVNFCCTLRLLKMRYTFKVFDLLKSQSLNFWHTIEIAYYYYITVNYWACYIISFAAYTPDCNETWLRRVPSPNPQGFRNEPDFWKDTSAFTAYTHAYYFTVSNISQVNIGDISAINMTEKIMAPFGMIMGAWFYYYITTNIIQMVANLTSASKITIEAEFKKIVQKLANGLTPEQVIVNVEDYFEYHKAMYDGLDEEVFLAELPHTLKQDILLSRFSKAITRGVLFRDDDDYIDIPLVLSIFKVMKFKIFMPNEFIIKIGQHTTDIMVMLDGEANVFGVYRNEFLGTLPCGFHYGNDLSAEQKAKAYFQHLGSDRLDLKLDPSDNFDCKSLINLVAKSFLVVGVLAREDYEFIFQAYPTWQKKIQVLNMFLFDIGRVSVEKCVKQYQKEMTRTNCLQILENNITYSTESMYDKIIEDYHSNPEFKSKENLGKMIKDLYLIEYLDETSNQSKQLKKTKFMMEQQQQPNTFQDYEMFEANGEGVKHEKSWMDKIVFDFKGKIVYLWVVQLVNLIYIGLMTPIQIGFDIEIGQMYQALEGVSLTISFAFFMITLRTPVIYKKEKTLDCVKVLKVYWSQDLMVDLIGLLPLNLILALKYGQLKLLDHQHHTNLILALMKGIRMVSVVKIFRIIYHFQNILRVSELTAKIAKAVVIYVMINHIVTCSWVFTFTVLEYYDTSNWMHYMGLAEASMPQLYLRSFYQITNIVTTTGSGDAFACTNLERVFFIFLMSLGDIIFGICFGYIANYTMTSTVNYEDNAFVEKIIMIDRYLNESKLSSKQKNLVQDYYSYQYSQQSKLTMLDRQDFNKKLPTNLANDIFYHNFKDDINQLFEQFGSENLARELCSRLNGRIFLPEDIIIERGTLGKEMFFVIDGVVNQIATDKKSVVFRFFGDKEKHDYFGEISLFFEHKRTYCMQAQTFCHLNELQKKDVDEVIQSYPKVAESMKVIAETKMKQLKQMRKLGKAKKEQHIFNGIIEASDRVESEDNEGTLDMNESWFSKDGGSGQRYSKTDSVDQSAGKLNNALYIVEEKPDIERMESKKIETTDSDFESSDSSSSSSSEVVKPRKRQRRLSLVQLGKTLKLKQKTGLRLQWVV